MNPKKQPTDQELKALLRDVKVPADMKDRLRQIPKYEDDSLETQPPRKSTPVANPNPLRNGWLVAALAACVAGIGLFLSWEHWSQTSLDPNPVADKALLDKKPAPPNDTNRNSTAIAAAKESIFRERESIDLAVEQLEIEKLRSQLAELNTAQPTQIAPRENNAMIRAIAAQTALNLGDDPDSVSQEMSFVIKKYPQTRGADLAKRFLDKKNSPIEF